MLRPYVLSAERHHHAALEVLLRLRYAKAAGQPTDALWAELCRHRKLARCFRRIARELAALESAAPDEASR